MNRIVETDKAPPPFSRYAQAMDIPSGSRIVHVSGQVGVDAYGQLPEDDQSQHELAWNNVLSVLDAADMDKTDIVDVLAIVIDHKQVSIYREVRDSVLDSHVCASTMLVCGLANPAWKVEVAVTAAKKD